MANLKDLIINGAARVIGKLYASEFVGKLTGNVTGDVTGNSSTATKLETKRSLKTTDGTNTSTGVDFDGSSDVSIKLPATIKATFSGNLTGNAATATTATKLGTDTLGSATQPIYLNKGVPTAGTALGGAAYKAEDYYATAHSHPYLSTSGGTLTGPLSVKTATFEHTAGKDPNLETGTSRLYRNALVISNPTTANDLGWIRVIGSSENDTILEIATGDDGNQIGNSTIEEIYVRRYTTSSTVGSEIKLLDKSNNTSFPGKVTATNGFSGNLTGNVTGNCTGSSGSCTGNAATATKLGTSTVGGTTTPIYLNAGTPTAGTALGTAAYKSVEYFAAAHSHPYLSTSGGTITGQISKNNVSTSWVTGRSVAPFKTIAASSPSDSQYVPILSAKSYQGSWDLGPYTSNILHLSYITDSNFNSSTNAQTADFQFKTDGTIVAKTFSGNLNGNATSATNLQSARTIDGVSFNGSANITHYGSCSTAAATAAKTVSCTGFTLATGARIVVKFTVTNTASSPTLNVNSTGAKAIYYRGSAISAGYLAANRTYEFVYNGTQYELIGDLDTNTWRSVVNNLSSTDTNASLSAAQGKVLNEKITNFDYRGRANTWSAVNTFTSSDSPSSGSTSAVGAIIASNGGIWAKQGIYGNKVYNAVWNDLADCIEVDKDCTAIPGYCYCFDGERYYKSTKYMDDGIIGLHSDTYRIHMGSKPGCNLLDVAVAGFVLAYVDKEYPVGTPLTCTENGYLTKIEKSDKIEWPEKIVATYWKNEPEEYWGDKDNKIKVNGRKWVKVK